MLKNQIRNKGFLNYQEKISAKFVITALIVIFIILISLVIYYNYNLSKRIDKIESTFGSREGAEASSEPQITIPKNLYNIIGTIQELKEDAVILKTEISHMDEKGEVVQKVEVREAKVTLDTKFTELSFILNVETGKKTPREKASKFANLQVGDYVEILSSEDISSKNGFEATEIKILPKNL